MYRKILALTIVALVTFSCNSLKPSGSVKNDPPDAPSNPYPADGAVNQEISLNMTWGWNDVDGDSLTFNIYFGTDANPPLIESNRRGSSFAPESLQYDHTYYWKVVADDGHGHQTGSPIWQFSTRALRSFDLLGQYTDASQGPFFDISGNIQSSYLYVTNRHSSGTRDSSLILDISNLNNISVTGYIRGALFGNQFGQGYLYSVGRRDSGFKLRAYSLGDPTNPNEEFRFDVSNIQDLAVENGYVYLYMNRFNVGQQNGVITVHDMAIVDTVITQPGPNWGRLRVFGNLLLLAEIEALEILNINNPDAPQIVTMAPTPGQCRDATISGTTIYIALHNMGIAIADISALPNTVPIGLIASVNQSTDLLLASQSILYVADYNLLIAYDITSPYSLYELARYQAPARITSLSFLQSLIITYTDSASTSGIQVIQIQP
ncbi:MAG TPA: hypothetical protein DCZ43_00370 [candidate division Zixibacteria bacterium]|nr:hypothetical protein [candidate division Zixibacteria bacterium]